MTHALLIGKAIYAKLAASTELAAYITDTSGHKRAFPIIADYGTSYPYVVFSTTDDQPMYTKDGNYEDTVYVDIVVASKDYMELLDMSQIVRGIFECTRYDGSDSSYASCRISGIKEGYDDGAQCFFKRLSFVFTVNK